MKQLAISLLLLLQVAYGFKIEISTQYIKDTLISEDKNLTLMLNENWKEENQHHILHIDFDSLKTLTGSVSNSALFKMNGKLHNEEGQKTIYFEFEA